MAVRRRRLIKIAWIRFGGIAAATPGRFSTARVTLPIRSSPPTRPSSPSPVYPAGGQRPFTACSVPDPLSSVPLSSSSRPRLARPFGVVYASGIQMTAFARAEECPTISAWLRSRTTRLQAGIRSLISFFSSPPSCGGAGNVLLRPYTTTTTLDTPLSPLPLHPRNPPFRVTDRTFPLYISRISTGRSHTETRTRSVPLSLIGFPRPRSYQWTRSNCLASSRAVTKCIATGSLKCRDWFYSIVTIRRWTRLWRCIAESTLVAS